MVGSRNLLAAALHDHRVGALVVARAIALGQLAPGRNRIALGAGAAFAAAVRMVDRVHRDPATGRPDAAPAHRTGFAEVGTIVFFVDGIAGLGDISGKDL